MTRLNKPRLYSIIYLLIGVFLILHSEKSAAQWQSLPLNSTRHFTSVVFSNNVGIISSDDDYALYRSTDFGLNWTRENTGMVIHTKVITTKPHTFFVNGYNSGYIYYTKNDGVTWDSVFLRNINLTSVSFPNPAVGYVSTGGDFLYASVDSGKTWNEILSKGCVNEIVNPHLIVFSTPGTGFIYWANDPFIPVTRDSGKTFSCDSVFNEYNLCFDMCFPSPAIGYACGSPKLMYKTIDSGKTWFPENNGINTNTLFSVYFLNDTSGYASGIEGAIYHTADGGKNWVLQQSGTSRTLNSIHFVSKDTGYAVGDSGTFLRTFNGGFAGLKSVINQNSTISIFPNPTKGAFSINLPEDESGSVEILDVSGKILKKESFEGKQIRLNSIDLSPGMYLFHLSTKNGAYYGKVIIS